MHRWCALRYYRFYFTLIACLILFLNASDVGALEYYKESLSNMLSREELLPLGRDRRDVNEKLENGEADVDDFPMRTPSPDYVVEDTEDDNQSVINPLTMTQLLVSANIGRS